jgi:hypothetical protein
MIHKLNHVIKSVVGNWLAVNLSQCFVSLHSSRQQHNLFSVLSPEDMQGFLENNCCRHFSSNHSLLDYYEYQLDAETGYRT